MCVFGLTSCVSFQWRWHSTAAACSLLLYCGVHSKWLTMIKHKMKLEWHYLTIYLKPWQISVCSNRSILSTQRIRKCDFFVNAFPFLWNQMAKLPICSVSPEQWYEFLNMVGNTNTQLIILELEIWQFVPHLFYTGCNFPICIQIL